MARPFNSELVVSEIIKEKNLRAYNVGFDNNIFRILPLTDIICNVIPEFSFGIHESVTININEIRERLKEAAIAVYTTDKYKKRGEFGELILHFLLRDFCNTIPLISKIYFKDTNNFPVHGFDGVHITIEEEEKKLWLGESKLYNCGKDGIDDLLKDLKKHFTEDYLRKEFAIIRKKIPDKIPQREYWLDLMNKHQRLDVIYSKICIPMVCTYSSDIFKKYNDNTPEFLNEIIDECEGLNKIFIRKQSNNDLDIILILFPIHSKDELITQLDFRLKSMQNI